MHKTLVTHLCFYIILINVMFALYSYLSFFCFVAFVFFQLFLSFCFVNINGITVIEFLMYMCV